MHKPKKFIGTTEECFQDLLTKHPELNTIELIGEFCCVERENRTAIVQRWQRGEYFPEGLELLRLRCLLHLAGYGVSEFTRMAAELRNLALTIVLRRLDPVTVNRSLGYRDEKGTGGLWRVLLQGQGYKDTVKTEAAKIVNRHKRSVEPKTAQLRQDLAERFGGANTTAEEPTAEEVVSWDDIAAIFARNIAAATTSAGMLLNSETAKEAALAATRDGLDLQKLKELINQFF